MKMQSEKTILEIANKINKFIIDNPNIFPILWDVKAIIKKLLIISLLRVNGKFSYFV